MSSEVGSGHVAILPIFKGFRKQVVSEVEGTEKDASKRFNSGFNRSSSRTGQEAGRGFKNAFASTSRGFADSTTKGLEDAVAKASRALSTARLREQDAAGKVRVAEAQLADARSRYAADSVQVVRAEERLATANRQVEAAQETTREASDRLRSAQGQLADAMGATEERAGRLRAGFQNAMSGMKSAASDAMKAIGTSLGAIALAAVAYLRKAVPAASELEQSIGGVEAVFKENSAQLLEWSRTAARTLGLTADQYNKSATIIGTFLKAAGIPMKELGDRTNDLVARGADLAAMFGGTVEEAVNAMGSALRGEFLPLRRYGVSLSQAEINARALRDTGKSTAAQLTQQEKVLATQALIFEKSADAAGQFARESNTLAGQQERLKGVLGNVSTTLGGMLLPALTNVTGKIVEMVGAFTESEAFQAFVTRATEFFTKLSNFNLSGVTGNFSAMLPVVGGLAGALGGLAKNLPLVGRLFAGVSGPVGILVGLIGAMFMESESLRDAFGSLWETLGGVFEQLMPVIAQVTEQLLTALAPVLGQIGDLFASLIEAILPILEPLTELITMILPILADWFESLMPLISAVVDLFAKTLVPVIDGLVKVLGGLIDFLIGVFTGDWERAWKGIQDIWNGIWEGIGGFLKGIWNGILGVLEAGMNFVVDLLNGLVDIWNNIIGGVSELTGFEMRLGKLPHVSIPRLEVGGTALTAGMALVGEKGPELVRLPAGAQVIPNYELGDLRGGREVTFINYAPLGQRPAQALSEFAVRARGVML